MSSGAGPVIRSGTRRHCVAEDHVQARHVCAPANSWVGWGNLSMCWPWQECPCTYLYHLGGLAWHTVVCSHWPELSGVPVGPWPAYGAGCIVSSEIKQVPSITHTTNYVKPCTFLAQAHAYKLCSMPAHRVIMILAIITRLHYIYSIQTIEPQGIKCTGHNIISRAVKLARQRTR